MPGQTKEWWYDHKELTLGDGAERARLTPKAGEVLLCLIKGRGSVVSTASILDQVWPRIHVTSDLVREYVSDLRRALGDDARAPRFIRTVRSRGYRLVGSVRDVAAEGGTTGGAELQRAGPSALSDDPSHLVAEQAHDIAAAPPSRTDNPVAAAGEQVSGSNYLVTGTVSLIGGRLQGFVDFVEVDTERVLLTRYYDAHLEDPPCESA